MAEAPPRLTVVLPTRNEAAGIVLVIKRVEESLCRVGIDAEIVVVDDSDDGTADVVRQERFDLPVTVIHREKDARDGLAGAAIRAFGESRGRFVSLLDADLQHPPELLPKLLEAAEQGADVVVASRFCAGGSAAGLSGPMRLLISQASRLTAKAVFLRRLKGVSDPLSGFFLFDRDVVEGVGLQPAGFKILLEILIRGRWRSSRDIPYRFAPRASGSSKASLRQGVEFLKQLQLLRMSANRSDSATSAKAGVSHR